MEMSTYAGIVSDALKFVNQSKQKINDMRPMEGETTKAEATTKNGVYQLVGYSSNRGINVR